MTYDERTIRETIAALGLEKALEQPHVRAAYETNSDLREFAAALEDVDATLPELAELTPPPDLIESTLAFINAHPRTRPEPEPEPAASFAGETSAFVGERGHSGDTPAPDATPSSVPQTSESRQGETGRSAALDSTDSRQSSGVGFAALRGFLVAAMILVIGIAILVPGFLRSVERGMSWDRDNAPAEMAMYEEEEEEEDWDYEMASEGGGDGDRWAEMPEEPDFGEGEWLEEPEEEEAWEAEPAAAPPSPRRSQSDRLRQVQAEELARDAARQQVIDSGALRGNGYAAGPVDASSSSTSRTTAGRGEGGDSLGQRGGGSGDGSSFNAPVGSAGLGADGPTDGRARQQPGPMPPADMPSSAPGATGELYNQTASGTTSASSYRGDMDDDDDVSFELGGSVRDRDGTRGMTAATTPAQERERREAVVRAVEEAERGQAMQEVSVRTREEDIADEYGAALAVVDADPEPMPEPEVLMPSSESIVSSLSRNSADGEYVAERADISVMDELTTALTSETDAEDVLDLLEQSEITASFDNTQQIGGLDGQGQGYLMDDAINGNLGWTDEERAIPNAAYEFFTGRESVAGVAIREATGYWRNTYVPGDTNFRRLYEQSTAHPGSPLADLAGQLGMFGRRQAYDQPFDAPTDDALAVFLSADRSGIDGESRVRVQVGIQASEQAAGRRPTMNVMLVMDRPETWNREQADAAQAYLEEMSSLHETGDAMGIIVAGNNGGTLVEPGRMGYGEVTVASRQLFGDAELPLVGYRDLPAAVREAIGIVAGSDEETSPLGGALVVIMTPYGPADAYALDRAAHEGSVHGVTTSIVALGTSADTSGWTDIALSGQGTLRVGTTPDDAALSAEEELFAASRIVARAVRLRIRLAPGVQLVNVLGSERLDEQQAERVRQQEQAVDQRLSRALGIQSDRGEDEDGIQIVIPAFYAGDSHIILLDVIAPVGGPVADVQIRYKDLTQLRNGLSRVSLAVDNREREAGPLEVNVLKNHLGHELSIAYADAATMLTQDDRWGAQQRLEEAIGLLAGAALYEPQLVGDTDLAADAALLQSFIDALTGQSFYATNPDLRALLELAGFMKRMDTPLHAETSQ